MEGLEVWTGGGHYCEAHRSISSDKTIAKCASKLEDYHRMDKTKFYKNTLEKCSCGSCKMDIINGSYSRSINKDVLEDNLDTSHGTSSMLPCKTFRKGKMLGCGDLHSTTGKRKCNDASQNYCEPFVQSKKCDIPNDLNKQINSKVKFPILRERNLKPHISYSRHKIISKTTETMNIIINEYNKVVVKPFEKYQSNNLSNRSVLLTKHRQTGNTLPILFPLIGLLMCVLIRPVSTQCSDNLLCSPNPADLLNLTFPLRSLSVSSTCGSGNTTTVYRKSTLNTFTPDLTDYFCNASDPHPPEHIADLKTETFTDLDITFDSPTLTSYWQSENTAVNGLIQSEEYIIVNFTDAFLIRFVQVIFVSPHALESDRSTDMRPRAMCIERMDPGSNAWIPWRYYAQNCLTEFPEVPMQSLLGSGPSYNATTPVCKQQYYSGDTETLTNWPFARQLAYFNPSVDFQGEYDSNLAVRNHYTTSGIRIRLIKPADNTDLSSYFAVADLEVIGQCSCYGHAASCTGENEAQCVCEHNTDGPNCEFCLPSYNNRPWSVGGTCEDCGCNGHSTTCHYDEALAYGVCDSCTDMTNGDKCQWCQAQYYVNPDKDNTTLAAETCTGFNGTSEITYNCTDWCIPCDCNTDGAFGNSFFCDNATGQCNCKEYVTGLRCDECIDGHWDLNATHPGGCKACACNPGGTLNSSLCDKVTGTCVCKENVQSIFCSTCKDGSYNLQPDNPQGCTKCGCDRGGSTSQTCDNVTGACACRPNINGRQCRLALEGYFVPRTDYLAFDAELALNAQELTLVERRGYGQLNSTVTGRGFAELQEGQGIVFDPVAVPRTFLYSVVLRYETAEEWPNFRLVFEALNASSLTNSEYSCNGQTKDLTTNEVASGTVSPASVNGGVTLEGGVCLKGQTMYRVTATLPASNPVGGSLLMDSFVLMPAYQNLAAYNTADTEIQASMEECYNISKSINLVQRQNLSCEPFEFSIMSEFMQQASQCYCDPDGSITTTSCDPYSGQCQCKPNVVYQDCSQCAVGTYNFTAAEGCTSCNCFVLGSQPRTCNDSGVCLCLPNVIGGKCDACLPDHYGLSSGTGCKPCACKLDYAYNNTCLDSGQCHCKPGVGGQNCDVCLDGAFNLTTSGCTTCECDPLGSLVETCDKVSGNCQCLQNVESEKCDTCKQGFYGLGPWSEQGCLECTCSGHTTNCTSAEGWFNSIYENTWSLLLGPAALADQWTGLQVATDGETSPVSVRNTIFIDNGGSQYVMRIENNAEVINASMLYFEATSHYLANKRGAYSQNLTLELGYFIPGPLPENFTVEYVSSAEGDVIIKGVNTQEKLVTNISIPNDSRKTYVLRLIESDWQIDSLTGAVATFQQMMDVLSDIEYIWVRALYSDVLNAYTDLYSASIEFSTNENPSTNFSVNNIEQCVCPEGFTGQFCEVCASGYTRSPPDTGPASQCVPCRCNSHGSGCDPATGVCECMHDTAGDQCETCLSGFYGDATLGMPGDCQPCQCPGNIIGNAVNVFSQTCIADSTDPNGFVCQNCATGHDGNQCESCIDGYYGTPENPLNSQGRCLPCVCNGRASTCNSTTGICVDCRRDTAGKECDICGAGFFGDAMTEPCQPCVCTNIGATGECNPLTGQCTCHPNVEGFFCEGPCAPNTYNLISGQGCSDCGCHELGALNPSCNQTTGQCLCNTNVMGRQCDMCADTFWNIQSTGCKACECTELGTINRTAEGETFGTCDLVTGQCTCALPGIIGRTCDQCAAGTLETYTFVDASSIQSVNYTYITDVYIGQYPECALCGECFDNWARKIDDIGLTIDNLYAGVLEVWSHYNNLTTAAVQPILDAISGNLTGVQDSIQQAQAMVDELAFLEQGFSQVLYDINNLTAEVQNLEADYATVENTLSIIKVYNAILVVEGTTITPLEVGTSIRELTMRHDQLLSAANTTWLAIQNLSNMIISASGDISVLLNRVTTAMQVLTNGQTSRQTTDILLSGTFSQGFVTNEQTLTALRNIVEGYTLTLNDINLSIGRSREMNLANNAQEQLRLSEQKSIGAILNVTSVQGVIISAKTAESEALTAAQATIDYRNVADNAKLDAVNSIETIARLRDAIPAVNRQKENSQELVIDIDAIQIEPLQTIEVVAQAILATSIPQSEVLLTYQKANNAKTMAEQAQQITIDAEEESQVALENVRNINTNIQEADRVIKVTQNDTTAIVRAVDQVNNVISLVNDRVTSADSLALTTESTLRELEAYIGTVQQCYANQTQRTQAATANVNNAARTIDSNAQALLTVGPTLTSATTLVTQTLGLTQNSYTGLRTVRTDMDRLQGQLQAITDIADLQALFNEATSQKIQMETLDQELITLDEEVTSLLTQLDTFLQAPSVSCIHN